MSIGSPDTAPPRSDLPYLRHRGRPRTAGAAAGAESADSSQALADFIHSGGRRTGRDVHPTAVPAPDPAPRPSPGSVLDLSAPAAAPDSEPPPAPPPPAVLQGASLLDLSGAPTDPAPAAPAVAPPAGTAGPATPVRPVRRARSGGRTILTPHEPSVTLTRVQSGVGTLSFEAVCSPEVGDLRLGCAYQLTDGRSSIVVHAAGWRFGPRDSRRPVIVGQREQYERISVDLRQCRTVRRLVVFGFSESGRTLDWGGTLVAATHADARIELPIELRPSGGVAVLMSLYNVRGEFVLRAEMEVVDGPIRLACRTYGFDRISWMDDRTPVE